MNVNVVVVGKEGPFGIFGQNRISTKENKRRTGKSQSGDSGLGTQSKLGT